MGNKIICNLLISLTICFYQEPSFALLVDSSLFPIKLFHNSFLQINSDVLRLFTSESHLHSNSLQTGNLSRKSGDLNGDAFEDVLRDK